MEEKIAYGTMESKPVGEIVIRPCDGIICNLGLYPSEPGIALLFDSIESLNGLICRLELLKNGMEANQNEN